MSTPEQIAGLIAEADQRRKKGQTALAQRLYSHVLDLVPGHSPALFGLGAVALDAGRADLAEAPLAAAVAGVPNHPGYQTLYGVALRMLGKVEQALAAFQSAQALVPDAVQPVLGGIDCLLALGRFADIPAMITQAQSHGAPQTPLWISAGQGLKAAQQGDLADLCFTRAIHADPTDPLGWQGRAALRLHRRQIDQALKDAQQAAEIAPHRADTWVLLAAVLRATGDIKAAISACQRALEADSSFCDGLAEMGTLLNQDGQAGAALEFLRKAYEIAPGRLDIAYNLAGCLMGVEQYAKAEPLYQQCAEQRPLWRDALTNLGVSRLRQGQTERAEQVLRQAVAIPSSPPPYGDPAGQPEAAYNLAWVQLLRGNFKDGWASYEQRWSLPDFSSPRRPFPVPLWDGKAAPSTHLFLHAEQGLGDTIQMLQLLPLVRARVGRLTVEVPAALVRLVQPLAAVDAVVVRAVGQDPGILPVPCDAHAPLMSLPFLLQLELTDLPVAASPYLSAPVVQGALDLGAAKLPRVGVVWAGSPDNKIDRFRSIPWDVFAPITAFEGVEAWSLQFGVAPPAGVQGRMEAVHDLADTACLLAQMDLVIGVDTAVLHLAAALGRPAWILLPFAPDYRWLEQRSDSPWYPSLRLFRQHQTADWRGVVEQVVAALCVWRGRG